MWEKAKIQNFGIRNGLKDVLLSRIPNHWSNWWKIPRELLGNLKPAAIACIEVWTNTE